MKSRSLSKLPKYDVKEGGIRFPEKIFLYLGLCSISVLFLGFTSAFLYTHFQQHTPGFRLPVIFHANTIIILVSSFTFRQAMFALKDDDSGRYASSLGLTLALGTLFVIFQIVGWRELVAQKITITGSQSASYLYLISGLHVFHVLGGLVGLTFCFARAAIRTHNPVADLMFVTDPVKKARVGLLATYWHFVDVLWLFLYSFFLLMLL